MQALGVHGAYPMSFPMNTPAIERSVIPSTSFSTASALTILSSFRCFGRGLNNRTPWILSFLFICLIVFNTSSSFTSAGRRNFSYATPSVSHRFVAPFSYAISSSLSPIRMIPSTGVMSCAFNFSTFFLISSLIEAFTSFPNSNFAIICPAAFFLLSFCYLSCTVFTGCGCLLPQIYGLLLLHILPAGNLPAD